MNNADGVLRYARGQGLTTSRRRQEQLDQIASLNAYSPSLGTVADRVSKMGRGFSAADAVAIAAYWGAARLLGFKGGALAVAAGAFLLKDRLPFYSRIREAASRVV